MKRTRVDVSAPIEQINFALAAAVLGELRRKGVSGRSGEPVGAALLDGDTRLAARLPGRMERFDVEVGSKRLPVVMDGAHVPFNIGAVLRDLTLAPDLSGPCVAIVALAADKDAQGFVAELAKRASTIVFTDLPGSSRGRSPVELRALAESLGLVSEVEPERKASARARARTGCTRPTPGSSSPARSISSGRSEARSARRLRCPAERAPRLASAGRPSAGPSDGARGFAHDEGAVGPVDRLRFLGLSPRTGGRPRRDVRARGRARGHAHGQRQVASLPASRDRARGAHACGFAADCPDARPGRPIARGRSRGGEPQFLLRPRRTARDRARPRRAFAPASLCRARAALARRHDRRLAEGQGRSVSPSTRRIASRNGATISAPNISACARSRKRCLASR